MRLRSIPSVVPYPVYRLLALLLALAGVACDRAPSLAQLDGATMGTTWSARLADTDRKSTRLNSSH